MISYCTGVIFTGTRESDPIVMASYLQAREILSFGISVIFTGMR